MVFRCHSWLCGLWLGVIFGDAGDVCGGHTICEYGIQTVFKLFFAAACKTSALTSMLSLGF